VLDRFTLEHEEGGGMRRSTWPTAKSRRPLTPKPSIINKTEAISLWLPESFQRDVRDI